MRYLLDTNIISDLVRNPNGQVAERIKHAGEKNVCTSIIVTAEIRYGAALKKSPRLTKQLEVVLSGFEILAFEEPADSVYGSLRAELQSKGKLIGGNDLYIAAHALALGYTLVTANEREFKNVPGLRLENWLKRN